VITAEDMIRVVCELAVRVERLEKLLLEFYGVVQEHDLFLIDQIFKTKLDVYNYSKKTPFKRLEELEQSLKGFITYYYESQKEVEKPKRKKGHSLKLPASPIPP